jgi:PTS system nitrogen regulatory IIA component
VRLNVREAAELLQVSTKTIYRWVGDSKLPGYRVQRTFRFDHAELVEWATANRIEVSPRFAADAPVAEPIPELDRALEAGGIAYRVGGACRDSALRAALDTLRLAHLRNPLRLQLNRPTVSLCFLERPVDWSALDRQPVRALFIILASTVRSVLQLHARTYFALRDPAFRELILREGSRESIQAEARRVAASFPPPPAPLAVSCSG